jgi:prolipoprotein diacylglyceryltransferase
VGEGMHISGCRGPYCYELVEGVFPTPLYEIVASILLFVFLWSIKKRIKIPGMLAAIYLVVNGLERFLVEQIRVNTEYNIFGFHPTQAELIAAAMIIGGIILIIVLKQRDKRRVPATSPDSNT